VKPLLSATYGHILSGELLDEIAAAGKYKAVPKGEVVLDIGAPIPGLPMLLEGAVKILRVDQDGDELLLYFLEAGDSCAMTLGSFLGSTKSAIRAVTEQDSKMVIVPLEKVHQWMGEHTAFRQLVIESFNTRLQEMAEALDSLAFLDLHGRMKKYLSDRVKVHGSTSLETTHAEIAADLYTSRVVVSRILKQLEREGVVELCRNRIELLQF
jgi:CRP/FNR family transcriptional regulator